MPDVTLPREMRELIDADESIASLLHSAIAEFSPLLRANRLTFFAEYTDHGIQHVNGVIRSAYSLLSDRARDLMTPVDGGVLALAILLHDIAMHLERDGFVQLVNGQTHLERIEWFRIATREASWASTWDEFSAEVRRFSGRQNLALFGSPEPVTIPILDVSSDWTDKQYLLCGEFLRRHHGRLAHEIAVSGFPAIGERRLFEQTDSGKDLRDLAGVIARSHTLPLRKCVDYVSSAYAGNRRNPRSCHVVFLMAVLRVADYLQIDSGRAPRQLLKVRTLRSPISRREWAVHQAVKDVANSSDDREAVFVDARPENATSFLRLVELLSGLQHELDQAWAVIGEVFGPVPELHGLGMVIRRVRSNLDDVANFALNLNYVPVRAAFEAADADLLKLLIAPLYGNKPEIGIRELIQNGVDAIRELNDLLERNPTLKDGSDYVEANDRKHDLSIDMTIDKESGTGWIVIADHGKGMTPEIVRNYFLRAGASFRMSDAWRKEYEDSSGHSRVLRSGRFGVGVLAAFLLGDEIEVRTRHFGQQRGVKFTAKLDTDPINLEFEDGIPIGTSVKIRLSAPAVDQLIRRYPNDPNLHTDHWDWYRLQYPRVRRSVDEKMLITQPQNLVPGAHSSLSDGWFRIQHRDYQDIQWRYEISARLIVNGIIAHPANESSFVPSLSAAERGLQLVTPSISVFDPDGKLPLRLDRLGLAESKLPFHEELLEDVVKDILAFALILGPEEGVENASSARWFRGNRSHPAFQSGWYGWNKHFWASANGGYCPVNPTLLDSFAEGSVIAIASDEKAARHWSFAAAGDRIILDYPWSESKTGTAYWLKSVLQAGPHGFPTQEGAVQFILGKDWISSQNAIERLPKYIQRQLKKIVETEELVVFSNNPSFAFQFNLVDLVESASGKLKRRTVRICEWHGNSSVKAPDDFGKYWRKFVPDILVPFDKKKRDRLLKRLDVNLHPHIVYWQAVAQRESR